MCESCCKPKRFFLDLCYWSGNRVSRTYYRIRDNHQIDRFRRPLIVASGSDFRSVEQIIDVLNTEDERRAAPCCCACHRP